MSGITANIKKQFWESGNRNLVNFERYYYGVQPMVGLTTEQLAKKEVADLWLPINLCRVIIDEPIGHITQGSSKLETQNPDVKHWAEGFRRKHIKPRLADMVKFQGMFGECYAYLWTDYRGMKPGLKLQIIPPMENSIERVEPNFGGEDPDELTEATINFQNFDFAQQQTQKRKIKLSPAEITEYYMLAKSESWQIKTVADGEGKPQMTTPNPWRLLPVIYVKNHGPSDLLDIINIQDDYNSAWLDIRVSRRYHAFPILTGPDELGDRVKIGAGIYLRGTEIERIDPGDLTQLLDAEARILERAAMVARSVALAEHMRGGSQMSGDALERLSEKLEEKVVEKTNYIEQAEAEILETACKMLARDPNLYGLVKPTGLNGELIAPELLEAAEFSSDITPKMPVDTNNRRTSISSAKSSGMYSQRQALIEDGKSEAEADRIVAETMRENAMMEGGLVDVETETEIEERAEDQGALSDSSEAQTARALPVGSESGRMRTVEQNDSES